MKIEYNNLNIPENFSEKFFLKTLQNSYGNEIAEIKEINFTMGSGGGENYCSDIYRSKIIFTLNSGKSEEISLIIKSMPKTETLETLSQMNVYNKEKIMYFDVLPSLEEISKGTKFSPKCFYAEAQPFPSIVFEDLQPLGYQMQDREIGMDKKHAKLVLTKIGKYHASTMKFIEQHPELLTHFKSGVLRIDGDRTRHRKWSNDNFTVMQELAKNWAGYESISNKLEQINGSYMQKLECLMRNCNGNIKVLNHGDLWLNNMMFKYDAEEVSDVLFIDFQLGVYKSPGIDINYFLTSSVQLNVLENSMDELIECYYRSLRSSLEDIQHKNIPSLDDIKNEILITKFYAIYTSLAILPVISMSRESSKDNSIEHFGEAGVIERKRKIMFSTERMHKTLKFLLKHFDETGLLDELIRVQIEEE